MSEASPVADAKRERVLEAAMGVVMGYGYARSTMDDIARAAGMSRPALYLVFRNKAEIYRAIASQMFAASMAAAGHALRGPGRIEDRLGGAVDRAVFEAMETLSASPHGAEILDLKNELAADLVADWRVQLQGLVADAIAAEAALKPPGLASTFTPESLAGTLLDVLEGMKSRLAPEAELRAGIAAQIAMIALALKR